MARAGFENCKHTICSANLTTLAPTSSRDARRHLAGSRHPFDLAVDALGGGAAGRPVSVCLELGITLIDLGDQQ